MSENEAATSVPLEGELGTAISEDSAKRRMGVEFVDDDFNDTEVCRVCRSEEGALYYPCMCTGSIKYVHQDCLMEWLKHSKKDVCELCHHKYSFQPIYRPDMPKRLPFVEILRGE
uniref:RING-type E3 ubiquitin transferase n=1 Tax=Steinernema glaseri TaxID=37863 RepID=A0A1I7ZH16_9BILA